MLQGQPSAGAQVLLVFPAVQGACVTMTMTMPDRQGHHSALSLFCLPGTPQLPPQSARPVSLLGPPRACDGSIPHTPDQRSPP